MPRAYRRRSRMQVLRFIREYYDDKGTMPTVREIQRGCNHTSTAVTQQKLTELRRFGYIDLVGEARGIRPGLKWNHE